MKTILVPIDNSENSQRALQKAKELAECLGSKIILLNVVSTSTSISYYYMDLRLPDEVAMLDWPAILKQSRAESQQLLDKSKAKLEGLDVETVMLEEPGVGLGNSIVNFAQQRDVDLIVMGSTGIGSLRQRLYMGSVATKVLHTTDKPVLLIQ